jgi:hypothetical protein
MDFAAFSCEGATMPTPDKPDAPKQPGRKWTKGGPSPNPGGKRKRPPKPVQPEAASVTTTEKRDTRFKPGNPGRPKGARHKTTLAMEALLEGEADAITRKAIELAKDGDLIAIRICMDRLLPPRRERPVSLTMPKINAAADLIAAAAALTDAAAQGAITPSEAASLSTLIGNTAKAIETNEFAERLAKLEAQAASKGNP